MDKSIYFIILDIGMNYEKGKLSGRFWKIGEKKRVNDEIIFWRNLIQNIRSEAQESDCTDIVFNLLKELTQKYELPDYKLILANWENLQACIYETDITIEQTVCSTIEKFLDEALPENNKYKKYSIIRTLHNLPRCMHGANCIQPGFHPISLDNALKYAGLK